jgi:hypothetical protein
MVACGTPTATTERALETFPSVRSSAEIEGRKIVAQYNSGLYDAAYKQVSIWTDDDQTIGIVFASDVVTNVALQLCAWRNDHGLHSRIAFRSASTARMIEAHKEASRRELEFHALNDYYKCYLKPTGPTVAGCDYEARELARMLPKFGEVWLRR